MDQLFAMKWIPGKCWKFDIDIIHPSFIGFKHTCISIKERSYEIVVFPDVPKNHDMKTACHMFCLQRFFNSTVL